MFSQLKWMVLNWFCPDPHSLQRRCRAKVSTVEGHPSVVLVFWMLLYKAVHYKPPGTVLSCHACMCLKQTHMQSEGLRLAANVSHVFMPEVENKCFLCLKKKGMIFFASDVPLKNYLHLLFLWPDGIDFYWLYCFVFVIHPYLRVISRVFM